MPTLAAGALACSQGEAAASPIRMAVWNQGRSARTARSTGNKAIPAPARVTSSPRAKQTLATRRMANPSALLHRPPADPTEQMPGPQRPESSIPATAPPLPKRRVFLRFPSALTFQHGAEHGVGVHPGAAVQAPVQQAELRPPDQELLHHGLVLGHQPAAGAVDEPTTRPDRGRRLAQQPRLQAGESGQAGLGSPEAGIGAAPPDAAGA